MRLRKIGLLVVLYVLLALAARWSGGSGQPAEAAGIPSPDLTVAVDVDNSGPNECDTDTTTVLGSTCSVTVSSPFTLDVYLRTLTGLTDGPDPDTVVEYDGLQVLVDYSGLTFNNRPGTGEVVLPGCTIQAEYKPPTVPPSRELIGCVDSDTYSVLTYTGRVFELDFTCPASPGAFTLSMVHATGNNSFVSDETFSPVVDQNDDPDKNAATPQNESLSINCVPASDGDGLSDAFEAGFGGGGIRIINPLTGHTATATGSAAAGSTITSGSVTVIFPPNTQVLGGGANQIEIEFAPGPPPGVHVVNATWPNQNLPTGPRKIIEMDAAGLYIVCIDDRVSATIQALATIVANCSLVAPTGCPTVPFSLLIPNVGINPRDTFTPLPECTSTQYRVSRPSPERVRIEGLVHSALILVALPPPDPLGGSGVYPEISGGATPGGTAGWLLGVSAGAAVVLAAGVWVVRRRSVNGLGTD